MLWKKALFKDLPSLRMIPHKLIHYIFIHHKNNIINDNTAHVSMYLKWASCTQICMFLSTTRKHCSAINNHTALTIENNAWQFHVIKPLWYGHRRSKVQCLYHWQYCVHCFHIMSQYWCQKNETVAMLVSKPNPVRFKIFSCVNSVFLPIKLHGYQPNEKKNSVLILLYGIICYMYKAISMHCLWLWRYYK